MLCARQETAFWAKARSLSERHPIECMRLTHATVWSGNAANAQWCRADVAQWLLLGADDAGAGGAVCNGDGERDGGGGSGGGDGADGGAGGGGGERPSALLSQFYEAEQLEANRLLILNCAPARALVDEWARVARERPDLFTDAPSAVNNQPPFREHRHDQVCIACPPCLLPRSHLPAPRRRKPHLSFPQCRPCPVPSH